MICAGFVVRIVDCVNCCVNAGLLYKSPLWCGVFMVITGLSQN